VTSIRTVSLCGGVNQVRAPAGYTPRQAIDDWFEAALGGPAARRTSKVRFWARAMDATGRSERPSDRIGLILAPSHWLPGDPDWGFP
jgi:hypothetical protein